MIRYLVPLILIGCAVSIGVLGEFLAVVWGPVLAVAFVVQCYAQARHYDQHWWDG